MSDSLRIRPAFLTTNSLTGTGWSDRSVVGRCCTVANGGVAMTWVRSRRSTYLWPIVVLVLSLILASSLTQNAPPLMAADEGQGNLPAAFDVNPDPNIFETFFVAMEAPTLLKSGLVATSMTFNGIVPGPLIRVKVNDKVIVHFTNNLPIPVSIHWHGIELTNPSDGTGITQNPVEPGGTFTYAFSTP